MLATLLLVALLQYVSGWSEYHNPTCAENREVIVHLFEWKWTDIKRECIDYLGPRGFCGVQVSPPNEHAIITSDATRPWWERYQPVSYILHSRSGTPAEFQDMVTTCNDNNVRIFADVVINHMAGMGRTGNGHAGSTFDSDNFDFPGVPFTTSDFNGPQGKCGSGDGNIQNYGDADQVRNCRLVGLTDLDQSLPATASKIVAYLNSMIDAGVGGFRVDAAKHMWPADIEALWGQLNNLQEQYYGANVRPFVYLEVIDMNNEPITVQDYNHLGRVTEFRYCNKIREKIAYNSLWDLRAVYDPGWGMADPTDAFVFVDNHDNQRGHGASGEVLTHKDPKNYKMGVAFTMANDYGYPRIMSSYEFVTDADGPPSNPDYTTKDVVINPDGKSCSDGWVCEHRWQAIGGMAGFTKAARDTSLQDWWSEGNTIAFNRGNKAFFAMSDTSGFDQTLYTGLPAGTYCNVISGFATSAGCEGEATTVDGSGNARVTITDADNPIFAIHVEALYGGGSVTVPPTSVTTTTSAPGGSSTTTTAAITATTTATTTASPGGYTRTVVFVYRWTSDGQDLFIRGGIDHNQRPGCTDDAATSACAIDINYNSLGTSSHYDKHNSWRVGDTKLDWYGAETGQGNYNGQAADGSPLAWTSSNSGSSGWQPLNVYGDHYWMVDVNMDCSQTESGWFEVKSYLTGVGWETNITQDTMCGGDMGEAKPYSSTNHMAKCGYINVFEYSANWCTINNF